MKFYRPIEFEIPDEWWIKSGMSNFKPTTSSYTPTTSSRWPTTIARISDIQPVRRACGFGGFKLDKMMPVLEALVNGIPIPRIEVHELPGTNDFRYGMRNGFHRFHASAAAGFEYIPIEILPYFDIRKG